MSRRRSRGFTLLEAIVALVIFSIGAVALYGWLSTSLQTLDRVQASRDRGAVMTAALDVVRRVNPMESPSGARDAGDLRVEWTATPLASPQRAVTQVGVQTPFLVALYELRVRVLRSGSEVDTFQVRQVGYRDVGGSPDDDL
ncbi:MAG TPA: prepilin-type N-terminal cleavage/methylation domain-containing protein [Lysobacter sp.]